MLALGVDVGGLRKGLDVVALDDCRRIVLHERRLSVAGLGEAIARLSPDVIAIDAPPAWAIAGERRAETAVRNLGFHLYQTPWQPEKWAHSFYAWMIHGFAAHRAAQEAGYAPFRGDPSVHGNSLEVFPNAIAGVLTGALRPPSTSKQIWRRSVLLTNAPEAAALTGPDQVDAALAALTGLLALEGRFCALGDAQEGFIVLPCRISDLLPKYLAPSPGNERGDDSISMPPRSESS